MAMVMYPDANPDQNFYPEVNLLVGNYTSTIQGHNDKTSIEEPKSPFFGHLGGIYQQKIKGESFKDDTGAQMDSPQCS